MRKRILKFKYGLRPGLVPCLHLERSNSPNNNSIEPKMKQATSLMILDFSFAFLSLESLVYNYAWTEITSTSNPKHIGSPSSRSEPQ